MGIHNIVIQRVPRDSEEAYLVEIGKIELPILVCHEERKVNEVGHEIGHKITPSYGQSYGPSISQFENQLNHSYWKEIGPLNMSDSMGRYFEFQYVYHKGNLTEAVFTQCYKVTIPFVPFDTDLKVEQDRLSLASIIWSNDFDETTKAQKLITYLLDRQMIIDEDEDDCDYNHVKFIHFYDQIISTIKQLDENVWKSNECQITIPTLNEVIYDYKKKELPMIL